MDLHYPRYPLEQQRECVREDDVAPLVPRRGVQRLLQVVLVSGGQLAAEVEGELVEAGSVEVDEREDLEEPLYGGHVLGVDGLVEPPVYNASHLRSLWII